MSPGVGEGGSVTAGQTPCGKGRVRYSCTECRRRKQKVGLLWFGVECALFSLLRTGVSLEFEVCGLMVRWVMVMRGFELL